MPNTPPDPNFTPRREFVRDQRTANAFSLLTISGSNFIRLFSFPVALIASLRQFLQDQQGLVTALREDVPKNLYEFTLEGKPWSSPKSVNSERLLVEIIAIIYQHGYSFLSTIDYGREHDDRLAVTFSKPSSTAPSPRSGSPRLSSSQPDGSGTNLLHQLEARRRKKVPFALSFASATLLRVINPPLHSTPAILQAVRGAWPRGVVSEKKIGDAYEFKLKGYKWFQEDTFASDSLRHILTLLSSLDTHAFTLLTSVSLTNRSRVKDLWIFTGLAPPDRDASFAESGSSHLSASNGVVTRPGYEAPYFVGQVPQQHRRHPSAPASTAHYPQYQQPYPQHQQSYPQHQQHYPQHQQSYPHSPPSNMHMRSATERPGPTSPPYSPHVPQSPHSPTSGVLRKPAPRAQVPISVNLDASMDIESSEEPEQFRAVLPSVISSNVENMTGVGAVPRSGREHEHAPHVTYAAVPARDYMTYGPQPPSPGGPMAEATSSRSSSPPNRGSSARPVSDRTKTPPLLTTLSRPSSPVVSHVTHSHQAPSSGAHSNSARVRNTPTPPLLGPGVFGGNLIRDSVFSSATSGTETSQEIPIQWTGGLNSEAIGSNSIVERLERSKLRRRSTGPQLPGAWADTLEEEKTETATTVGKEVDIETEKGERPLHDVDARVDSPELVINEVDSTRKSEAGLIGIMTSVRSQSSPQSSLPMQHAPAKRVGNGNGWVLVNVEGKQRPDGDTQPSTRSSDLSRPLGSGTPSSPRAMTLPPAARTVVIAEAKEGKLVKKSKSKGDSMSSGQRPSGLKRLLSFSKRADSPDQHTDEPSVDFSPGQKPSRSRLRDKIKLMGVAEASPRSFDDKRLSID